MARYDTDNPVPSSDMRDIWDDNLIQDEILNGDSLSVVNRKGKSLKTWSGIEAEHLRRLDEQDAAFQSFLESSGYNFLGDYGGGPYTFTARNQYIRYANQYWRINKSTPVGFKTTGNTIESWNNDVSHFVLIDGDTLRQEIASASGAGMIGYKPPGDGSVLQTVKSKLDNVNYVSDYGVKASNSGEINAANLQRMLNELSGKNTITSIVFAENGVITVKAPIVIPNNTDIEIKAGCTVSGGAGNLKPVFISEKWSSVIANRVVTDGFASNTTDLSSKSDYIGIWGGGSVDYSFTSGNANTLEMHAICIASVKKLKLGGGLLVKGAIKYSYLVANISYLDAQGLQFNNASDGLHLQPPIDYAYVRNLYGYTGDDMFAMTGGDYLTYDLGLRGSFNSIDVKGIFGLNSLCAVKLAGNSNTPFNHVTVEGVYGSFQHSVARIWTDGANLSSTKVKTFDIKDIGATPGSGYPLLEIKTVGASSDVTVDNFKSGTISTNLASNSVHAIAVTTGTAGNASVRVYNAECDCPRDVSYFFEVGGSGAGSDNTRVDCLKLKLNKTLLNSSIADANVLRITRGQVNSLTIEGSVDCSSGQAVVRKSSGKIDRTVFNNLNQQNGYAYISTGVHYDGSIPRILFIGGFFSNPDKIVSLKSGSEINLASPNIFNKAGEIFETTSGVMSLNGVVTYGNSCIPTTSVAGVTWNIRGFGIFADAGNANPAKGFHCYNTNTGLAGVGPVVANGGSWVSII